MKRENERRTKVAVSEYQGKEACNISGRLLLQQRADLTARCSVLPTQKTCKDAKGAESDLSLSMPTY